MLGLNLGVVVLHDSEAVRYRFNTLVRIVLTIAILQLALLGH